MIHNDIRDLYLNIDQYVEKDVFICGWVKTIRESKTLGFIELGDGTCFKSIQIVFEEKNITNFKEIAGVNVGAALVVRGKIVLTPDARQPFELSALEISIEGESTPDYPLQKGQFHTCDRGQIPLVLCLESGQRLPLQSISFSINMDLSMHIRQSLPEMIVRVQAKCSGYLRLT